MLLVTETVKSDLRLLQKSLHSKLESQAIEQELKGLCDLVDFLEALPDELPRATLAVRRSQGPEFKLSIARALVEYRSDLEANEKKIALEHVRKVLENYIDESPETFRSRSSTLRSLKSPEDEKPLARSEIEEETKSPTRSFKEIDASVNLLDLKGYLEKKVSSGLIYHQRYFAMKNGRLYWYKNDKSYNAQGSLGLNTLQALEIVAENTFKVTFEGRDLELRAENQKEMETWVQVFNRILEPEEAAKMPAVVFSVTSESSLFEEIDDFLALKLKDRHAVSSRILSSIPKAGKQKKVKRAPSVASVHSAPETPYRSASIDHPEEEPQAAYFCFCIPLRRPAVQEPLLH